LHTNIWFYGNDGWVAEAQEIAAGGTAAEVDHHSATVRTYLSYARGEVAAQGRRVGDDESIRPAGR
jgi:hypothetical protein